MPRLLPGHFSFVILETLIEELLVIFYICQLLLNTFE